FDLRKNPLQIARYASPRFMVRFASGHLTIPEAEKKASNAFKGALVAIISDFAVIGADVDKPADIEIVSRAIEERDLLNVQL
ncbi:MAG: hypothetical protein HGA54_10005, partial [Actinobacteria bacterium]|nr:hypothetical protein [Actinomycetota bacterium]